MRMPLPLRVLVVAGAFAAALVAQQLANAATFTFPSGLCPDNPGTPNDIEQCIDNNASPGDTIKIKPGTYYEQQNDVNIRVTITAADPTNPPLIDAAFPGPPAVGTPDYAFSISEDGTAIKNLSIRHAGDNAHNQAAIEATADDVVLGRLTIVDASGAVHLSGDGFRISNVLYTGGYDMDTYDISGSNGLLKRNTILSSPSGGFILTGDDNVLTGNTSLNSTDSNNFYISGAGNTLQGNVARNSNDPCYRVFGAGNTLTGNSASLCGGSAIRYDGAAGVIRGNNLFDNGSDGIDITGDLPVVDANRVRNSGGSGIYVTCDPCSSGLVSGNLVTGIYNENDALSVYDSGSCSGSPCLQVLDNVVHDNDSTGIYVDVRDSVVQGNRAWLNGAEYYGYTESGIYVAGSGNLVTKNTATFNTFNGLVIDGGNNTVSHNLTLSNGVHGLRVYSGSDNLLDRNTSRLNHGDGIVNDGTNTDITNNSSKSNRADCTGNGTYDVRTGNFCADGSDFDGDPTTLP